MTPALVASFRPNGPWRFGAADASGASVRFGRSDQLYSAVCHMMRELGVLSEWLGATALAEVPQVRFTSVFPFVNRTRFIVPPRSLWPPEASPKVRWKAAQFIPLELLASLLRGEAPNDDQWTVDAVSGCLLSADRRAAWPPYRVRIRTRAAVDRLDPGAVSVRSEECLEFADAAGMWTAAVFASEQARSEWGGLVRAAFLLLGDSGIGANRSSGWGGGSCSIEPADLEAAIGNREDGTGWWLLSLFYPSAADIVDWTRGSYDLVTRSGFGTLAVRMVAEGAVLTCEAPPIGAARDVAREGAPHPVFRFGAAVALRV